MIDSLLWHIVQKGVDDPKYGRLQFLTFRNWILSKKRSVRKHYPVVDTSNMDADISKLYADHGIRRNKMRKFVELDEYADSFEGGHEMSDLQLIFRLSSEIEQECGSPAKELFELYAFNKTHAEVPIEKPNVKGFIHDFCKGYLLGGSPGIVALPLIWKRMAMARGIAMPWMRVMPSYATFIGMLLLAGAGVIATGNGDTGNTIKSTTKKVVSAPVKGIKQLKKRFASRRNA